MMPIRKLMLRDPIPGVDSDDESPLARSRTVTGDIVRDGDFYVVVGARRTREIHASNVVWADRAATSTSETTRPAIRKGKATQ